MTFNVFGGTLSLTQSINHKRIKALKVNRHVVNDDISECVCNLLFVEPSFDGCSVTSGDYQSWRCQAGVGEGTVDFPPGQSFPLEANLDFMNGGVV